MKWLLCLFAFPASAVILGWDAVPGAIGYRMYQGGASHYYTNSYDCRGDLQFTNHLTPGTYYFAVTAYNTNGESDFSDEISYTVGENRSITTLFLESAPTVTGTYQTVSTLIVTNTVGSNTVFYRGRLSTRLTNY